MAKPGDLVGEVTVHPGDYAVADSSGVAFIAAAELRSVLEAAEAIAAREAAMTREVEAGRPVSEVMGAAYEQMLERKARRTAASRGLNEAVTWSFIAQAEAEPFGGARWILDNPISEEMKAMRPSLLTRRRSARPSVVLPEPDSPTMPTVWPSRTASDTPSTALM